MLVRPWSSLKGSAASQWVLTLEQVQANPTPRGPLGRQWWGTHCSADPVIWKAGVREERFKRPQWGPRMVGQGRETQLSCKMSVLSKMLRCLEKWCFHALGQDTKIMQIYPWGAKTKILNRDKILKIDLSFGLSLQDGSTWSCYWFWLYLKIWYFGLCGCFYIDFDVLQYCVTIIY